MPGLNGTKVRGLRQRTVACLILLGVLAPVVVDAVTARAAETTISVENAWSRATPNGAEVAIGFATIKNSSDEADRFISVTTEVAGQTQIHEMTMEDGVMKMRQLRDGLAVPAKGEVVLKPGSYHLMLMQLKQPLKEGGHFSGTFTFEKAGPVNVVFDVKGMGATDADAHQGH